MRSTSRIEVFCSGSPRLCGLVLFCLCFAARAALAGAMNYPAALDQGYRDMYNLDFAGAHAVFQQYMTAHPQEPLPVASDAAAYLFGEFDRLHIIDVQLFANQDRFDHRGTLMPDPGVRRSFDERTEQAERQADAALARDPKDVPAL
jgi:hypothetical protein